MHHAMKTSREGGLPAFLDVCSPARKNRTHQTTVQRGLRGQAKKMQSVATDHAEGTTATTLTKFPWLALGYIARPRRKIPRIAYSQRIQRRLQWCIGTTGQCAPGSARRTASTAVHKQSGNGCRFSCIRIEETRDQRSLPQLPGNRLL